MKYISKDDRMQLYDFLKRTQMILVDQIKRDGDFINQDKLFIVQQCLSFFNHHSFYVILDSENTIIINEYCTHNQMFSGLPNVGLKNTEVLKKSKKSL